MKTLRTLFLVVVATGCGSSGPAAESGAESESEGSGESTDALPTTCSYDGQLYASGELIEVAGGCITYRCDHGALAVEQDSRRTVAGDVELADQQAVDEHSCVGEIEGSLTISGTAADLTPLQHLARVGGTLDISAADVVSLSGLEGIAEIGTGLVIAHNEQLTTLAFQPYMSVFGDVTIDDNDALVSLAGAGFLGQCATCSAIDEGEGTTGTDQDPGGGGDEGGDESAEPGSASAGADDTGPGGGTFYGNILVANNDALTDISALGGLAYAWASLRLRSNATLTSLSGLQLVQVSGDLEISGHAALAESDALAYVNSVEVYGLRIVCGNAGGEACP